ncbi:MAG: phosphopantetheine-binding protein, partial [Microcystis sp.]
IWSQVLRVEPVGIYDNFFELGGDSILTIQIITRARKAGLELTPKQLFTHQSIAELATVATRVTESQTEPEIVNPPPPEADTGDYTAQDFPLLEIDQIELEQILAQL